MRRGLPLALLLLAGCSYDWVVASSSSPSDAGPDVPADGTPMDVSDALPVDAVSEPPAAADAEPSDADAGSDAVAPPDCTQLLQDAKSALGPALVCNPTMANVCKAQAHDWCGCPVYLADGTSTAAMKFVSAVSTFDSANCRSTILCPDSCPSTGGALCVISDAAGMYACFQ